MRLPGLVFCSALAALLVLPASVLASPGTVWLTADIKSPQGRAEVRLPLEWLASTRTGDEPALEVSGVRVNCAELWKQYQALPAGESRDVLDGTTSDGERYVLHVVSDSPAPKNAEGKVRVLSHGEDGKDTEVGFPLSFAKVLDDLTKLVPGWAGDDHVKAFESKNVSLSGHVEFTKLALYGPFTALDARGPKSRVRISIE